MALDRVPHLDTRTRRAIDGLGSNFVPYIGAEANVDLGSVTLTTTGLATFGNLTVDTLNFNGNVISDSGGTISFNGDHISSIGTTTAEQLTSTDDITMQGHLLTMGDAGAVTDTVLSFVSSGNSTTITYDQSEDAFDIGGSTGILLTTGTIQVAKIEFTNTSNHIVKNAGNDIVITALGDIDLIAGGSVNFDNNNLSNGGVGNFSSLVVSGNVTAATGLGTFQNATVTGTLTVGNVGAGNYMTINSTGDQIFYGTGGIVFGEISVKDNAAPMTLNSAAKVQVTVFDTDGVSNRTTPSHANDHITIDLAGMYHVKVCITAQNNAAQSHKIEMSIWKNNGTVALNNVTAHRNLSGGSTDVGSISICGIIDCAINDTIELWADTSDAADRSITIEDVTLSLVQVGGT